MANWTLPTTSSNYTTVLTEIKDRDENLAVMFDSGTFSNIPTGTIRWNSANSRFEKWSGTVWNELDTDYAINVASIGGFTDTAFLKLAPTGDQTITAGKLILDIDSAAVLDLKGGTADNVYMQFFADAAAQSTRSALIGYATTTTDILSITNEQGNGAIQLTAAGTGVVSSISRFLTSASTTTRAGVNIPHGAAPSVPVDGDWWTTTAGAFVRINGVTQNLLTPSDGVTKTGTPVNNQVAVFTDSDTVEGHTSFTYDSSTASMNVAEIRRASDTFQIRVNDRIGTNDGLGMGAFFSGSWGAGGEIGIAWGITQAGLVNRTGDGQAMIYMGGPVDDGYIVLRTADNNETQGTTPDWTGGVQMRLDSGTSFLDIDINSNQVFVAGSSGVGFPQGFTTNEVHNGRIGNVSFFANVFTVTTGTKNLDVSATKYFFHTLTWGSGATVTFNFQNLTTLAQTEGFGEFWVETTDAANGSIVWPAEVEWAGGTTPTPTSGRDIYHFMKRGNGDVVGILWAANVS